MAEITFFNVYIIHIFLMTYIISLLFIISFRIQPCDNVMTTSHVQCKNYNHLTTLVQCHYTMLYTHLTLHCHATLPCNIFTLLYPDIVYMLSFDRLATNIGFWWIYVGATSKNLLTTLWQRHFVCWAKPIAQQVNIVKQYFKMIQQNNCLFSIINHWYHSQQ